MAKKTTKRKTAPKKVIRKKSTLRKAPVKRKVVNKEVEPEYMVQVGEPKTLRKNILESLREVIIFMQSYEKFRQIQEEKVTTFNQLKGDIKELSSLLDHKLKRHFPKGKLSVSAPKREIQRIMTTLPENYKEEPEQEEQISAPAPKVRTPTPAVSELDELESQLKDIEGQLRRIN
jgi:hypothetical protein